MPFARYVAIGDSQTEGLLDPDGRGGYRGWADRFAEILTGGSPHLSYANLAVRGRLLGDIRGGQLEAAIALQPDVATVMGGLNDLLRPGFSVDLAVAHVDAMLAALRQGGRTTVLTNTFPAIEEIAPLLRRLAPRVTAFNAGIRDAVRANGALLVDFADRGVGTDARLWSADRIHANSFGHSLIAAAFADTVGVPGFGGWGDPLPLVPSAGALRRARTEARWLGAEVAPWLLRRARGRSSGDGITAKRPRLLPVASVFHLVAPVEWPTAGWYRPPSLATEGFVHLSFADQVAGSADRHFAGADDLVAIELEPAAVDAEIRVEDSYGGGVAFPHAYGPLPVSPAVAAHAMRRGPDGKWAFPG